jgi:hypothetical protein
VSRAALVSLCLAAAFAAVRAQASLPKHAAAPKPQCVIGTITYSPNSSLVAVKSGKCYVPAYRGHAAKPLAPNWSYSWTGYDQSGAVVSPNGKGAGKSRSFTFNSGLFYTLKVTFTITSPEAGQRPKASGSKSVTIKVGGLGSTGETLDSGPGTTPPPVINGVNPLCPFTDSYVETFGITPAGAQCGVVVPGSNAFVTPPTISADGTVEAGRWLSPAGPCAVPPANVRGPFQWFGSSVTSYGVYLCGNGSTGGSMGVSTITLVNADGSSCTLHPGNITSVAVFRLPLDWGGTLKVTFLGVAFDSNGNRLPGEYETAQFQLTGSQNGCASPLWSIQGG